MGWAGGTDRGNVRQSADADSHALAKEVREIRDICDREISACSSSNANTSVKVKYELEGN